VLSSTTSANLVNDGSFRSTWKLDCNWLRSFHIDHRYNVGVHITIRGRENVKHVCLFTIRRTGLLKHASIPPPLSESRAEKSKQEPQTDNKQTDKIAQLVNDYTVSVNNVTKIF
jgi:hypothetical protein